MNIAFCTCVQLGLSCIQAIQEIGGEFKLLISLTDHKYRSKSGRIYLDKYASELDIPLLKIEHINDQEVIDALNEHQIDWLFIIGWSQIAGRQVIETPTLGAIGAHPTLLPIGRGRAAIPWAILNGLNKTGVSFFKMDEGVDTGPILAQMEIPLDEKENATSLYEKVSKVHVKLIKELWQAIQNDRLDMQVQDESIATYWPGRKPEDGRIDVLDMTVNDVDCLVRATTRPYPGAYILLQNNKKKIIWRGSHLPAPGVEKLTLKDGDFYILEYSIE